MEIHQLLPGYQYGDAISNHAAGLRRLLRSWGYTSDIFSQHIGPSVRHDCRHIRDFRGQPDSVVIYHCSIGADEITDLFLTTPGKRLLVYHNITPPEYFAGYDEYERRMTRAGRDALADLREAPDLVLADSPFNCREIAGLGFREPRVLPIVIDFDAFASATPCPKILNRFDDDWTNFLFVGRLVPNKRQDDVIRTFACYNRLVNRRSRLFLVGSDVKDVYLTELRNLTRSLGVVDHVEFAGHVRFAELAAYYRRADLFLCLSEHEGFCVPILEAFYHEVPVIAFKAAAVPDTMGQAGILVRRRDHAAIAEVAHLLVSDPDLRDQIINGQSKRLCDFEPRAVAGLFRRYLDELLAA